MISYLALNNVYFFSITIGKNYGQDKKNKNNNLGQRVIGKPAYKLSFLKIDSGINFKIVHISHQNLGRYTISFLFSIAE
jgi:hypothetical protein